MMKVIISAGGSGGHIYPALGIINKIVEMNKDAKILYIGTTNRMESTLIPELGIDYVGVDMQGFSKKNLFNNVKTIKMFLVAIKKCKSIIKSFNPDVVIGVGGYITAPVIYSAKKLGYKTIIHEQNSIPGKSNRFLSKYADKIMVSMKESMKYFDKKKTIFTGNPRSEEIIKVKAVNKLDMGLSLSKKLIIIVMGSQGSFTINNTLKETLPLFKEKSYEVLLITGKKYYDSYKNVIVPSNVKIVPFLENMLNVLKKTDLIVTRAGASTVAEITSIGIPSILVPSPYVANNHQYYNAKELFDEGAAEIILEKDFSTMVLIDAIDRILVDEKKYASMHEAALKFAIPNSGKLIYDVIKEVVRDK